MFRKSLLALAVATGAEAFSSSAPMALRAEPSSALCMKAAGPSAPQPLDRRALLQTAFTGAVSLGVALPALAEDGEWMKVDDPSGKTYWYNTKTQKTSATDPSESGASAAPAESEGKVSRMGGLLSPFKDVNKGFSIFKPLGWNQFDSAPGEYDVKWEDLVEKSELVMVGSNPVKTATDVSALGDLQKVGDALAAKKKAKLVDAVERTEKGIRFYTFTFQAGEGAKGAREMYQLCVNKGRLWSVTATTAEKRWNKRKDLYNNIMLSFSPKL